MRQGRLQEEINRWVREGLSLEQARVNARHQIAAEMQAESNLIRKSLSNPEGFVSSSDAIEKAMKGVEIKPYSALDDYAKRFRLVTGDAFHGGLMAGMDGGSFWDAFKARMKYAAASGLADSLTSGLFGSKGLVQSVVKGLSKFGGGTNFAPGGLSLVGEYGPEIVDLPRGSKVRTAAATQALIQNMAGRAANAGSGEVVNFHYSPTNNFQGTSQEISAFRAEMENDRRNFKSNVIAAYTDARARRQV